MGGVCGVAVESDAVRISYFRDGQRVEDSIDAEGASWLLSGKLVDCGPFDDVVLTGRDADAVESLLASLDTGDTSTIRMVDEGAALLAYARSVDELMGARALLVLDLGRYGTSAFTLDVVANEVTRSSRRAALSGESLDDVVERLVMDKEILPPANGVDAEKEYRAFFRELKELVSTSAGVRAPGEGPMLLTREEFEEAITSTLLQTLAWAAPEDPDAVLLIGGQAQIPLVKSLVEQEWTVPLVLPDSPGSVILEGAALEALPSVPRLDLDQVLEEHQDERYAGVLRNDAQDLADPEGPVLELDSEDDLEPSTTPIRIVAPATDALQSASPLRAGDMLRGPVRTAPDPTSPAPTSPGPTETDEPAGQPSRRRVRWSVRDAMGLVGVAAVVVLVWGVVVVRSDTPPPPGIGIEPVDVGTSVSSSAEGIAPEPTAPTDTATAGDDVGVAIPTEGAGIDEQQFAEVGFGSGTGLDVGN